MNLIDSKAKVNFQYKISARKGKATDWINKSSEPALKYVNMIYNIKKLLNIPLK